MKKITFTLLFILHQILIGQVGIGTPNPNANAVLELNSTNKGLLLPRLPLTATNNASPLATHAVGMTVYNTATNTSSPTNPVYPGEYYNDGTKWERKLSAGEIRMIAGGTMVDQVSSTTISISDGSVYTDAVLLTLPSFTLDRPSIVEFNSNISTSFSKSNGGPLDDGSVKLARSYYVFTNAPTTALKNTNFGYSSVSYTNTSTSNGNVISGYYYLTPRSTLYLPAGTYTLAVKGGGASATGFKLTFGNGSSDNVQIQATPVK